MCRPGATEEVCCWKRSLVPCSHCSCLLCVSVQGTIVEFGLSWPLTSSHQNSETFNPVNVKMPQNLTYSYLKYTTEKLETSFRLDACQQFYRHSLLFYEYGKVFYGPHGILGCNTLNGHCRKKKKTPHTNRQRRKIGRLPFWQPSRYWIVVSAAVIQATVWALYRRLTADCHCGRLLVERTQFVVSAAVALSRCAPDCTCHAGTAPNWFLCCHSVPVQDQWG